MMDSKRWFADGHCEPMLRPGEFVIVEGPCGALHADRGQVFIHVASSAVHIANGSERKGQFGMVLREGGDGSVDVLVSGPTTISGTKINLITRLTP